MKWRDWRLASWLSLAGLLWCAVVGLLLWFLPLGETASSSSTGETVTGGGESFASLSGYGSLPLIVPAALCALALFAALHHHRIGLVLTTAVSGLFAFLAGFSIGLFYVPAVLALILACLTTRATHETQGDATLHRQRAHRGTCS
mgnify:CR=1 FL=1